MHKQNHGNLAILKNPLLGKSKYMATYLELKAQAEALLKQAEQARKQEIAEVVAEIKQKMAEYGITVSDLGLPSGGKKPRKSSGSSGASVARYKGPNGEGWSGMGRQPQWLKDAIEQGKSKEDFAV